MGNSPQGEPAFQQWPDPHGINPFNDDKDIVDRQVAAMQFSNGITATFHTNCMAAMPERRFYILGSEGTLRLDAYSGSMEIRRIGWDMPKEEIILCESDGHAAADDPMCRELADCMLGLRAPAAGFREGIESLVVAQAIDTAMGNASVVDLGPLWRRVDALLTT